MINKPPWLGLEKEMCIKQDRIEFLLCVRGKNCRATPYSIDLHNEYSLEFCDSWSASSLVDLPIQQSFFLPAPESCYTVKPC